MIVACLVSTCSHALPMPMEEGYKYPEPEIPFTLPPRRTTTTTTTTTTTRAPTTGYKYPVRTFTYILYSIKMISAKVLTNV